VRRSTRTSTATRIWTSTRLAPSVTLVVGLLCAVVGLLRGGQQGLVSALVGTAVVALFFASGALPLLVVRGQEDRAALGLGVLLVNYSTRLALTVLLLRAAARASLVDVRALGLTVIACTLAWSAAQVALLIRPGASG
jgi:ATP synthase protein I